MLILTAFNSAYADIGTLCIQSIARYCRQKPGRRFVSHRIPDDYARPASWKKLELIQQHLPKHDWVLWIDADALIVGSDDFEGLFSEDATLNICEDANGINHGVAAWRNCPEAFAAIQRAIDLYAEFKDDPWYEQRSLMSFLDEIKVNYVEKKVMNAYREDVCEESLVLHFPGLGSERLEVMKGVMEV